MRKRTKHFWALLLVLALLPLAACGDDAGEAEAASDTYYALTGVSAETAFLAVTDMAVVDGTPYLLGYDTAFQSGLYRLNPATGDLEYIYETVATNLAADREGGLWLLETDYGEYYDETLTLDAALKHLDADGALIGTQALPDTLQYTTGMASDGEGNLYIADMGKIHLIGADGTYTGEIEIAEYAYSMSTAADGGVVAYDSGKSAICPVDLAARAYGDAYSGDLSHGTLMDGDEAYDVYIWDDEGIWGVSADGTAEEVLNWLDCGVSGVTFCGVVDGENFLVMEQDLFLLSRREGGTVGDSTTLTLATTGLDEDIESAILRFNRADSGYRVEIVDYSGDDGLTRLNTEILSGDIPDLIDLGGLPVEQYVAKGLLADLGELMEADERISRADYSANILEALEVGGGLYSIVPGYEISTVVGLTSQVGGDMGWTYADYEALLRETGSTAFANLTQEQALSLLLQATESAYVDREGGVCDFTSGSFVRLLEMAGEYPAELDESGYTSEVVQLETGQALLSAMTLRNSSVAYQLYESILGGDMTFIGYPTPDGTGGSGIVPLAELGIMAGSEHVEGAWACLAYLLGEEIQTELTGFPLLETALDAALEDFMDLGAAEGVFSTEIDGEDVELALTAMSAETVAKFRALIDDLDTVRRPDTEILDIVTEEAAAYFTGTKTGDQVAELVENRVSTYLSEQN